MRRTRRFAGAPESVTLARDFANEVLEAAPADARESAVLMISELSSNCVRHAESGFELRILHSEAEIRVEASDTGRGRPKLRHPAPTDPNGRGLQIVDMLASSWGVERLSGGGKTVWFTLLTHAPAPVGGAAV